MINHGFDMWHLGVVERVSAYDGETPERGCEKDRSVPVASTIAELKFIEPGEELQLVVAWDNGGGLRGGVDGEVVVGWRYFRGDGCSGRDQHLDSSRYISTKYLAPWKSMSIKRLWTPWLWNISPTASAVFSGQPCGTSEKERRWRGADLERSRKVDQRSSSPSQ